MHRLLLYPKQHFVRFVISVHLHIITYAHENIVVIKLNYSVILHILLQFYATYAIFTRRVAMFLEIR